MALFLGELLAGALFLILLSAPLVFGLQRLKATPMPLLKVVVICAAVAAGMIATFGSKGTYYIGYYLALPLLAVGLVVLALSFATRRKNYAADKKCPFCAESIKAEAILCRFCGKDMPSEISVSPGGPASTPPALGDVEELRRQSHMSLAERNRACWACHGNVQGCVQCKIREDRISRLREISEATT